MSKTMVIARVSTKGQVTIPQSVRELLHISKKGDLVGFKPTPEGVLMKHLALTAADEELTNAEWKKLERLAGQKGKVYTKAVDFLKDLGKL